MPPATSSWAAACGIGALVTAASNPGWQVTAIDYNPAHIAIGAGLARAARLDNIRFIEADLAQLATSAQADAIPQADFVSMHGLWSWVSNEVRAGIVRLLAAKTRPGGMVHLSYNALPAWQGALGMQRLIYETGIRAGGRSDMQAQAGLALARDLKAVESKYLTESSLTRDLLDTDRRHVDGIPFTRVHERALGAGLPRRRRRRTGRGEARLGVVRQSDGEFSRADDDGRNSAT